MKCSMKLTISLALFVCAAVSVDALSLLAKPHSTKQSKQHAQLVNGKSSGSCFQKVPLSLEQQAAMAQSKIPGAGMDPTAMKPFSQVYKDGFMLSACIKDKMFYAGDAFGNNKFSYAVGKTLNVSVVHYSKIVPREDRKPMTPTVCFNFCRTMKDMHFFGITNGRECYCTPFYHQEAGDSSDCDAVCDGDVAQMCGGKTKSSTFEMHACQDGPVVLGVHMVKVFNFKQLIDELAPQATEAALGKQVLSAELQAQFGKVGDPAAADLMQKGKESAGELLHAAERAAAVVESIHDTLDIAFELTGLTMKGLDRVTTQRLGDEDQGLAEVVSDALGELPPGATADFSNFAVVKKADGAVALMKEQEKLAEVAFEELQRLYAANEPEVNDVFFVKSGSCVVNADGCVMTKSMKPGASRDKYLNAEDCVIELPPNGAEVTLKSFSADPLYDYLEVNGKKYTSKLDTVKCDQPWCSLSDWKPLEGVENAVVDSCFTGPDSENAAFAGLLTYTGGTCPDAQGEHVVLKDVTHVSGVMHWHTDFVLSAGGFEMCASNIESKDNAIQYYPIMYFVDKTFVDVPTTCTGTIVGEPIYYKSVHSCAAACDSAVGDCVGFSYYPDKSLANNDGPNICFLFSSFDSLTYYTGCDEGEQGQKSGFIQKDNSTAAEAPNAIVEDPVIPVCGLKLSKFVGTNIAPDPSGKCPGCLKNVNKAARCFKP